MHKKIGILVLLGLLSIVASSASAQNNVVQFDEYGNGTANGNTLPFVPSAVDPVSNLPTLKYELPYRVIPGDLFLTEAGPAPQTVSDLVRFDNLPTTAGIVSGVAFFFSDGYGDETPIPLADNPFGIPPANSAFPPVILAEQGIEGGINGLFNYTPAIGAPGSDPSGVVPVTYNIYSDGQVPEPTTLVLLGMSALGLLAYAWRKRK
jgi:hypothetical protein